MSYTKVSIPKSSANAGAPIPKDPTLILVDVDDVKTEPTRSAGDVNLEGDLELNTDAKAIGLYLTPSSIAITEEISGEDDGKGFIKGVEGSHPGDTADIRSFVEASANKGFIALVKDCDGTSAGRWTYVGSKCNPVQLSLETTLNNEATKRKLTFKQGMADSFMPGLYSGAIPEIADASTSSSSESA